MTFRVDPAEEVADREAYERAEARRGPCPGCNGARRQGYGERFCKVCRAGSGVAALAVQEARIASQRDERRRRQAAGEPAGFGLLPGAKELAGRVGPAPAAIIARLRVEAAMVDAERSAR